MPLTKNHYLVLGIPTDSTPQEIRAAFRRLAKEFHPDRCRDRPTFFLRIQEAYTVLRDPESRRLYDESLRQERRRHVSVRSEPLSPRGESRSPGRPRRSSPEWVEPLVPEERPGFGRGAVDFRGPGDDLASLIGQSFFCFSGSIRGGRQQHPVVEVVLTRQQALRGGVLRVLVPGQLPCPACDGSGERGFFSPCAPCGGTGAIGYDYPVRLEFPPDVPDNYVLRMPLESFGRRDSWLTLRFRVR